MTTIQSDVASNETVDELSDDFDGAAAFLNAFAGDEDEDASKKKPSEEGNDDEGDEPSNDDEHDSADEDEGSETSDESPEDDETNEDEGSDKKYVEDDGAYLKIKVGDEEHEVPVKDLKRLFGQEAALTRKSQEVSDARKAADATIAKNLASINVLIEKAKEKAAPYKNIDWALVSKDPNITGEEFSALRAQAQAAFEEEAFLTQNLNGFMAEVQKEQAKVRQEEVKATITALTTAPTDDKPNPLHIEGWNEKTYDDVRSFGVSLGAPADVMNNITDTVSIKVLHMAMLFAKGASKVQTQKVAKTPKKIVKTSNSPVATRQPAKVTDRKNALSAQRKNGGDTESTVAAFMVGLTPDED